jgi:hypothetical protein
MVPLNECRMPTLISLPLTPGEAPGCELELAASPPLPQPAAAIVRTVSPATTHVVVPNPRKLFPSFSGPSGPAEAIRARR